MEKENHEQTSHPFRYMTLFYLMLLVYVAVVAAVSIPYLKRDLAENRFKEHIALWKDKEAAYQATDAEITLYNSKGEVTVGRTIAAGRKDELHYVLEALLLPLEESELQKGCISFIPAGTRLIGASSADGYFFVELSKEFLGQEDVTRAVEQMKKTLSLHFETESLTVICEGNRYTL